MLPGNSWRKGEARLVIGACDSVLDEVGIDASRNVVVFEAIIGTGVCEKPKLKMNEYIASGRM